MIGEAQRHQVRSARKNGGIRPPEVAMGFRPGVHWSRLEPPTFPAPALACEMAEELYVSGVMVWWRAEKRTQEALSENQSPSLRVSVFVWEVCLGLFKPRNA